MKTYSWDNAQVVLVGNKCDLEDERVVSTERGRQLASQMGMISVVLTNNHCSLLLLLLNMYRLLNQTDEQIVCITCMQCVVQKLHPFIYLIIH